MSLTISVEALVSVRAVAPTLAPSYVDCTYPPAEFAVLLTESKCTPPAQDDVAALFAYAFRRHRDWQHWEAALGAKPSVAMSIVWHRKLEPFEVLAIALALADLESHRKAESAVVHPVAAEGLAALSKTQLASLYVERCEREGTWGPWPLNVGTDRPLASFALEMFDELSKDPWVPVRFRVRHSPQKSPSTPPFSSAQRGASPFSQPWGTYETHVLIKVLEALGLTGTAELGQSQLVDPSSEQQAVDHEDPIDLSSTVLPTDPAALPEVQSALEPLPEKRGRGKPPARVPIISTPVDDVLAPLLARRKELAADPVAAAEFLQSVYDRCVGLRWGDHEDNAHFVREIASFAKAWKVQSLCTAPNDDDSVCGARVGLQMNAQYQNYFIVAHTTAPRTKHMSGSALPPITFRPR